MSYMYKIKPATVFMLLFLCLMAFIAVMPIIYIINHAFKPVRELFLYPPTFFVRSPSLKNIGELIMSAQAGLAPFSRYLFNSIFVSFCVVFLVLTVSAMCAYPLSKHKFPGKNAIIGGIILLLAFTPEMVGITRYIVITNLGVTNTYWGHILPRVASPICVFLMKQFIDTIPDSYCESAKIDGAGEVSVFLKIIVPLARAAIGCAAIITFTNIWGPESKDSSQQFMTRETMKTLSYFVDSLSNANMSQVARAGGAAAGGLMLFLPNFILFFVLQRSMMETMVHSGIKE